MITAHCFSISACGDIIIKGY